jgi:hypothetical protein
MERIMSGTKIMDAQQTSEVRELTAAELDSVNGGSSPSLLEFAAGMVITGVAEGVVLPLIRAGWV